MWLDDNLSWSSHIQKLIIKIGRNSNLIKYNKNTMPRDTKSLIYHSPVLSHVQYGIILWGNSATLSQINRIQKIQDRCTQFIIHNQTKQEKNRPLEHLNVDSLITLANYKFGYRLLHNLLPSKTTETCLHDSVNNSLLPTHQYSTRHEQIPNLPKTKHNHFLNSFLCKGPRSIISLNVETINKPTLQSFT